MTHPVFEHIEKVNSKIPAGQKRAISCMVHAGPEIGVGNPELKFTAHPRYAEGLREALRNHAVRFDEYRASETGNLVFTTRSRELLEEFGKRNKTH